MFVIIRNNQVEKIIMNSGIALNEFETFEYEIWFDYVSNKRILIDSSELEIYFEIYEENLFVIFNRYSLISVNRRYNYGFNNMIENDFFYRMGDICL